jgi:ATP-dependent RNA helicase DeaD
VRSAEEEDDDEQEMDKPARAPLAPKPAAKPAKPAAASKDTELPAPASGYKWIALNLGKNDGLTPRDIVDAITEGGEFPAKAVGLIKLQDSESHVQVLAAHAADIVESLDGGNFEGRAVRAWFPRTKASPFAGKSGDKRGKFSDKPRSYPGKPRPYGERARTFGPGSSAPGGKPQYGPPRDRPSTGPGTRDDGPRGSYSRSEGPHSGPPRAGGYRKGPGGPKKGPGRW